MKNILVAIEDCEATTIESPLLERSRELASAFGSELWLVHVVPRPGQPPFNVDREVLRHEVAEEYRHEHDFLQQLARCLRERGIDAHARMVEGPPAATLLEEATRLQADLVMLGCHRHRLSYGVLLDTTEESILGKCRSPIMFVPLSGS
jgi:nucleotide-binding universal stress UspA family protein